jgi:hypothetical protein
MQVKSARRPTVETSADVILRAPDTRRNSVRSASLFIQRSPRLAMGPVSPRRPAHDDAAPKPEAVFIFVVAADRKLAVIAKSGIQSSAWTTRRAIFSFSLMSNPPPERPGAVSNFAPAFQCRCVYRIGSGNMTYYSKGFHDVRSHGAQVLFEYNAARRVQGTLRLILRSQYRRSCLPSPRMNFCAYCGTLPPTIEATARSQVSR